MTLLMFIYTTPFVALFVISGLTVIRYCNACAGYSRWYIWIPFGVREIAVCEASEELQPLGIRTMFLWIVCGVEWLCLTVGLVLYVTVSYRYRIIPNIFLFISGLCYTLLYVIHCIYIYRVSTVTGKHGIIWTVLHVLFGFIADPFVYHYIARDIEQEA